MFYLLLKYFHYYFILLTPLVVSLAFLANFTLKDIIIYREAIDISRYIFYTLRHLEFAGMFFLTRKSFLLSMMLSEDVFLFLDFFFIDCTLLLNNKNLKIYYRNFIKHILKQSRFSISLPLEKDSWLFTNYKWFPLICL